MSFFHRLSRGDRSKLRIAVIVAIFLLLAAQFGWWLIFFELNQRSAAALQERLDRIELRLANGEGPPPPSPTLLKAHGRYVIDPAVASARRAKRDRQLAMLLAETLFVMVVLSYGSYRVMRSIRNELDLIRERNVFLDSVSHELKTPVAGLRLALQTLLRRQLPDEQRNQLLQGALRDTDRLEEQTNNLLMAAGLIKSGRSYRSDVRDVCNLGKVARSVVAEMANSPQWSFYADDVQKSEPVWAVGEEIRFSGDGDFFVGIRQDLAESLLRNLIRNARLYAPGGAVEVSVRETRAGVSGALVELCVADRGPGIPAAERRRVFEPLYRLARGNDPYRGTGMGLFIVREIVTHAGGSVHLEDRSGGGLLVIVRLPARSADETGVNDGAAAEGAAD